ncbi:MAG: glutaminyl-peptide cyclotransferase [Candidatus Competibacteraceae bacterium]|nr:glutaminyl-peptide cyclotransferase [Candidatus Competibacteraceae bacterium]
MLLLWILLLPIAGAEAPVYGYRVVNSYPHDPEAFTQGLIFHDGQLYEGTGLWGRSELRRVDLETGKVLARLPLPRNLFGEGIALVEERIFQITWQSGRGFVYHRDTLEPLASFRYPGEGWGLAFDGRRLIMSNGSATLLFLDPRTLEITGHLRVYDGQRPVTRLNELEVVEGEIFANVWMTDRIARIDPHSGLVTGWIDLSGLLADKHRQRRVDVLNGIAYDPENRRLFVTGKLWPKLFEIELVAPPPQDDILRMPWWP